MRNWLNWLNHHFNVLHVYCRLCQIGLKKSTARAIASWWERRTLYSLMYRKNPV